MKNKNTTTTTYNGTTKSSFDNEADAEWESKRKRLVNYVSQYHRECMVITLTGDETMCIAESILGISYREQGSIAHLGSDIFEANFHYGYDRNYDVDAVQIAAKLRVAPIVTQLELLADIKSAWILNDRDPQNYLSSLRYRYSPFDNSKCDFKQFLVDCELADRSVVLDRNPSHVSTSDHIAVRRALAMVEPEGRDFIQQEVVFPNPIGFTQGVHTTPEDTIVYAKRVGRMDLTRFVKGREPEPCNSVFVVLKRLRRNIFLLVTGFVGHKPEPEPWDEKAFAREANPREARERSRGYWANHALVYNPSIIDLG